jgi:integrase
MSRKAFFRNSCWYVKSPQGDAVRLCDGTPEERQLWRDGKRQSKTVTDKKTGKPVRVSTDHFPVTERVEKALARYTLLDPADPVQAMKAKGATTVAQLVAMFMADREASPKCNERTLKNYRRVLVNQFAKSMGACRIDSINGPTARQWLGKMVKTKVIVSDNTHYLYTCVLKCLFNYAVRAKLLPTNELRGDGFEFGNRTRREILIGDSDRFAILDHASPAFADFFTALLETGRRPDEIAHVRISEVIELGGGLLCWRIAHHKNRNKPCKAGEPQIIDLTPTMIAMTRRLMLMPSKDGLLFHSPMRKRWRGVLWCDALHRAIDSATAAGHKLTPGLICYAGRHSFITKALKNNVPSGDIADMVGNTVAVIENNYNHLSKQAIEARQRRILAATAGDMSAFAVRTA